MESETQLDCIAHHIAAHGTQLICSGAYKPRTSPYSFQGFKDEGLRMLRRVSDKYGLYAVTEILDPRDVEAGVQYSDIIQIGSRNKIHWIE